MDLTQYINYMPYRARHGFSLDRVSDGRGSSEPYCLVEREATRAVVEALPAGNLALRTEYLLEGEQLAVRHHIENRGPERVTVSPVTHPQWDLDAFGPDAQVNLRRADGSWSSFALNPEGRSNRDLEFGGEAKPAGEWRLDSAALPLALRERFDPDMVQHARLVLSTRGGSVCLQLYFRPVTVAPSASLTVGTTWLVALAP